ncbi:hypothetical protein CYMTET_51568 [Cymbomonas tetramitiformis]|uniref:Prolyl 4-hydroxylase alpha subunit Fe(2+) 2OG dioxygenase domain-containing protein n=1 Tax=Cymbomonas tetramitiformis TaxID=36881 RepID=A0AAE0BKS7_9CHLO|nr:hypothetical protein CYMTET_51568 [Cymbomonas tetramitiformis]
MQWLALIYTCFAIIHMPDRSCTSAETIHKTGFDGLVQQPDGITAFKLDKIALANISKTPFRHIFIPQFIPPEELAKITADFPKSLDSEAFAASKKNVEEREVLATGDVKGAYAKLITDAHAPALKAALFKKFGAKIPKKSYSRVTLRGTCIFRPCGGPGSVHHDSKNKIISVLIYLNQEPLDANSAAGNLLLLRSKNKLNDKKRIEVPSWNGNLVAFFNTPTAWHGLETYSGSRRAIQINYETPDPLHPYIPP